MFSKKVICPSCGVHKTRSETQFVIALIKNLLESQSNWANYFYGGSEDYAYRSLTKGKCWACDACIDSGKAVSASPSQQTFCDAPPYLAYIDVERKCRTCLRKFTFSKIEQKYWYEELGFWVQSEAVNCKKCRKENRLRRSKISEAQFNLSKLLLHIDKTSESDLREVIALYQLTESTKKVSEYTNMLKKVLYDKGAS